MEAILETWPLRQDFIMTKLEQEQGRHTANSDFVQKMESLAAELEAKLTQLHFARDKTDTIITKNNRETIKRHQQTLKTLVDETDGCRLELEALKLVNKEDAERLEFEDRGWN